nr:MAG TPA: hypothetical protein [Caudoviricetes sp.]
MFIRTNIKRKRKRIGRNRIRRRKVFSRLKREVENRIGRFTDCEFKSGARLRLF